MRRAAFALLAMLTGCGGRTLDTSTSSDDRADASVSEATRPPIDDHDVATDPPFSAQAPTPLSQPPPPIASPTQIPSAPACPPATAPTGDVESIGGEGIANPYGPAALYPTPFGIVARTVSPGFRGGSCSGAVLLRVGDDASSARSLSAPGCSNPFDVWQNLVWMGVSSGVRTFDLSSELADGGLVSHDIPLVDTYVASLVAGPAGLVFHGSPDTMLYHLATPDSEPRVVARRDPDTVLWGLNVDATHAYGFETAAPDTATALKWSLESGVVTELATLSGAYTTSGEPPLGGGKLYAKVTTPTGFNQLVAIDVTTGEQAVRRSTIDNLYGLAADDEYFYWVSSAPEALHRVRHCGGEAVTIATGQRFASLALDERHVYWATHESIVRLRK